MKNYASIRFITAIVTSNISLEKNCRFRVASSDTDGKELEVIYTSPFYLLNQGGVVAIPEVGSEVLVLQDTQRGKNYYIATVIDYPENSFKDPSESRKDFDLLADKGIYSEREKPQKVNFTNQFNSGLKISRKALPNYISAKVDLDSEGGKRISLSDSNNANWVLIRNEHGDSIVLTAEANDILPERSLEIKTKGQQQYVSFNSAMNFYVIDGRDITFENYSSGAFGSNTGKGRAGNITLRSYNSDINIVGKGDTSEIFITTPKARIQIQSDGSVFVESLGSVSIKSDLNINLEAANSINLKALNINMQSDANTSIQSTGLFSVRSTGVAAIDGQQVHLNSQLSLPVVIPPSEEPKKNDFNE